MSKFTEFARDIYSPAEIYRLLVEDLNEDGKTGIRPSTTFTDDPPDGMGYSSLTAAQQFVQKYVNSRKGRARYNVAEARVIRLVQIPGKRNVGNLAILISGRQVVE